MSRFADVRPLGAPMRTHRKVLCILFLAILVTASTAVAEPTEGPHDGRSIGSWALSVLDSIAAFLLPDEAIGGVEPGGNEDGNEIANGDYGGAVDPNG
jgi:hypothetical protein